MVVHLAHTNQVATRVEAMVVIRAQMVLKMIKMLSLLGDRWKTQADLSKCGNSYPEYISTVLCNKIKSLLFCVYSNVPPNQGGKYSGFGYTMDAPPRSTSQEFFDTAVSSLSSVKMTTPY